MVMRPDGSRIVANTNTGFKMQDIESGRVVKVLSVIRGTSKGRLPLVLTANGLFPEPVQDRSIKKIRSLYFEEIINVYETE
jgi:hypothetical protein